MSDKQKKDDAKIANAHERDKDRPKPAPLPIRSAPDIFASSEATHLLDKNEETSLLNTIEEESSSSKNAFKEVGHKTQILTTEAVSSTDSMEGDSASKMHEIHSKPVQVQENTHGSTTQLLDTPSPQQNPIFDSGEHTRALSGMFQENEEKTAFFHTQDERAIPKPPTAKSQDEHQLVDPTPRRSLNQQKPLADESSREQSAQAPSPLPRRSGSRDQASPKASRSSSKIVNHESPTPSKRSQRRSSTETKPKRKRSNQRAQDTPPKVDPLNAGVFAEDASVVLDDVINQVVEDSWKAVPESKKTISKNTGSQTRARLTTTQSLWLRIIVGFCVLLTVGFLFRSKPSLDRKQENKRSVSVVTPLNEQLPKLGIELPLSDSARKLRPGTDIFILGRQRILLLIDGADQSEFIHTDSLARTIKNSANLTAIKQQLSGVTKWPQEISLGLNKSTSIAQVKRVYSALDALGVMRINLLTDSQSVGGIGELGIDISNRDGSIPSVGALEMKVESALISIALLKPNQPAQPLHSLDAFTPSLHQKLDQHVETFAFEHPRIVRAFLRVPRGLRLSQVIELARPLVHDERMRRITVLPYAPTKGEPK